MRFIALVSLTLALAAASMPLSTRANDIISTAEEGLAGPFGQNGSGSGNAAFKYGTGDGSATGSVSGTSGRTSASGSGSGKVDAPGSGTDTGPGSGSGTFSVDRRSTIEPNLDGVKAVSQAVGEAGSAITGTSSTTLTPEPNTSVNLRSRTTTNNLPGAEEIVDPSNEIVSTATEKASAVGNGVPSGAKGAASDAADSLGIPAQIGSTSVSN